MCHGTKNVDHQQMPYVRNVDVFQNHLCKVNPPINLYANNSAYKPRGAACTPSPWPCNALSSIPAACKDLAPSRTEMRCAQKHDEQRNVFHRVAGLGRPNV